MLPVCILLWPRSLNVVEIARPGIRGNTSITFLLIYSWISFSIMYGSFRDAVGKVDSSSQWMASVGVWTWPSEGKRWWLMINFLDFPYPMLAKTQIFSCWGEKVKVPERQKLSVWHEHYCFKLSRSENTNPPLIPAYHFNLLYSRQQSMHTWTALFSPFIRKLTLL